MDVDEYWIVLVEFRRGDARGPSPGEIVSNPIVLVLKNQEKKGS